MTSSTVFTSNDSQVVWLPKAVAFPEGVHHVDILKIGYSRLICFRSAPERISRSNVTSLPRSVSRSDPSLPDR